VGFSRFQVSGFRFQVSGFRFQVSGVRCQIEIRGIILFLKPESYSNLRATIGSTFAARRAEDSCACAYTKRQHYACSPNENTSFQ
jgi:hypothetical protein